MDYIASKVLQHSWTTLVFALLSMVPLCFVFQAKYRKSLFGSALSKETYLFPRTPPSSCPLWISTQARLWSGLSECNSGPELMSLLWSKSNAIYRHSVQPVLNTHPGNTLWWDMNLISLVLIIDLRKINCSTKVSVQEEVLPRWVMRLNESEGWRRRFVHSLNSHSPSSSSSSSRWVTFGMRGQRCVPAGWPLVMRRQVSGRPGSALSASPGNTNSDGTKAHRNSCKAAVLCAPACSDAHPSFHWKNRNINKR